MIDFLLPILVSIACCFIVTILVGILEVYYNDKQGYTFEKRVRNTRRTYDDGLGKYTVDIKDEEWVRVPKNRSKK